MQNLPYPDWMDGVKKIPYNERWTLERQGKTLKLRRKVVKEHLRRIVKRKPITHFTRKSRFNLLLLLGKVDWDQVGDSSFITLTYPDECVHFDKDRRNTEVYLFQRHMEKYLGAKVGFVWRIEWKKRQRGAYIGELAPHIHILTYGGGFLGELTTLWIWRKVLGVKRWVSTHCEHIPKGEAVGCYIAKYCGKVDPSLSLDNVPNLNSTGKHWGLKRRELVPWCRDWHCNWVPLPVVRWLRERAAQLLPWYRLDLDSGFTLLGKKFEEIIDALREKEIDNEMFLFDNDLIKGGAKPDGEDHLA